MCGIYGTTIGYSSDQIKSKLERTKFRGPDQMGSEIYTIENGDQIIFGHNRLSIVDLDPRSNQPFTYYNKVHLVFNGEIYNFKKIKETLANKGYTFNTSSDTEVLCAAYLEWGGNCVDHLIGMFAFVIYDIEKQELFGARDRLGQKPFYYYHDAHNFEFASQISSIELFNKKLTISKNSISYYLGWGTIPDPYSIYNEIKKIKPGHCFKFNLTEGTFKDWEYWDIDYVGKSTFDGSYNKAKEELTTILQDAIASRLFADVPVGVFLSGGIDSSLVAALATKSTEEKVKTFSVKFDEKGFDESIYAKKVADHLKTEHHIIHCNFEEGLDLIENFTHYYDEPFADSSSIPSMLLAKYTKKHVTVALSGDGGDESFLGYHRYDWLNTIKVFYALPKVIRKLTAKTLKILPYYKFKTIGSVLDHKNINIAYRNMMGSTSNWFTPNIDITNIEENKYILHKSKNIFERASDFDLKTYLNWDINTKVDRATMAYSLEARSPLLDHRVVDFAQSLPTKYKFSKGNQKRILKDILYDHVPKTFFDRPKAGFTMPFKNWFRKELKDYVLTELCRENLKNMPCINVTETEKLIADHMNGTANNYPQIWRLLILRQWLSKNGSDYKIK